MISPLISCVSYPRSDDGDVLEVIRNVSLQIPSGCFCTIVGHSGYGKTTLIHTIVRLIPFAGVITINEQQPPQARTKQKIGILF
jgi:ABC-type Mn2+/Zn2+ transport system ATPase subunit